MITYMLNSDTELIAPFDVIEINIPDKKIALVTIHDACPRFESKILEVAKSLENLDIKYNIGFNSFF